MQLVEFASRELRLGVRRDQRLLEYGDGLLFFYGGLLLLIRACQAY